MRVRVTPLRPLFMAKPELKARVVALRLAGESVRRIEALTDAGRGSVSLWCRAVQMTEDAKARLQAKCDANRQRFAANNATVEWTDERRRKLGMSMRIGGYKPSPQAIHASAIRFTGLEMAFVVHLERATGRKFRRELVNGHYLDFCDDETIFEYTEDHGKGVSNAIKRLSEITDGRRKTIVCDDYGVGPKRRAMAAANGISVISISSIVPA